MAIHFSNYRGWIASAYADLNDSLRKMTESVFHRTKSFSVGILFMI